MYPKCVALAMCSLLLAGCKKDSPVGTDNSSPDSSGVTAVIGPAGGTIMTAGFRLTIAPGAFAKAETLSVSTGTYDNAFGSRNVTDPFRLEGLPGDFMQPLDIRLKCTRAPSSGLFLAIGSGMESAISGSQAVGYIPLNATLDSGHVRATLSPTGSTSPGRGSDMGIRATHGVTFKGMMIGVDDMGIMTTPSGSFIIYYPRPLKSRADFVALTLEYSFPLFLQYGFDTGAERFLRMFPVHVYVGYPPFYSGAQFGDLYLGQETWPMPYFIPLHEMFFNETVFGSTDDRTLMMAAEELFALHLSVAQDTVFKEYPVRTALLEQNNRVWPYFSIISMLGDAFSAGASEASCPLNFRSHQLDVLAGLPTESGELPSNHGLGYSALISHLAQTYSSTVIPGIFYAIADVSYGPDAIFQAVPESERIWWPGFLKEYISGNIYGVQSGDFLKDLSSPGAAGVFTIAGKTDTLHIFSNSYNDLSAKLFRVNLEYPGIDTSAVIRFSVGPSSLSSQYVGVMLFGFDGNTLTYWEYANAVTVSAVRDLTMAGYDIVAAVVNCLNAPPYYGSRTIDLTVSVETKSQGSGDASGYLEAEIAGTGTDNYSGAEQSGPATWMGESGWRNGTFANGKFAGSWSVSQPDPYGGTETDVGELTITLKGAAPPAEISAIYFRRTAQTAGGTEVWELTSSAACSIPAYWENGAYVYRISGTDLTNNFATVYNRYDGQDGFWRLFSSPAADGRNRVEIKIVAGGQGTQSVAMSRRRR